MKFTCLIVDDEPLARKLIASHVSKIDDLELVGECGNAIVAGNFLRTRKVNLIFLDIQMPEINGLQFIGTLKNPPAVILTTAYRDFAPEAFDLDVIDYLLKPISFDRLTKAVNKFFDKQTVPTSSVTIEKSDTPSFLHVRSDRKVHKILLDDIHFLESLDEYVKVHLDGRTLITRENISSLEQKLPFSQFIRIHRSFLINTKHVKAFTGEAVDVGGKQLPFGRAYKKTAMAALLPGSE